MMRGVCLRIVQCAVPTQHEWNTVCQYLTDSIVFSYLRNRINVAILFHWTCYLFCLPKKIINDFTFWTVHKYIMLCSIHHSRSTSRFYFLGWKIFVSAAIFSRRFAVLSQVLSRQTTDQWHHSQGHQPAESRYLGASWWVHILLYLSVIKVTHVVI